MIRVICPVCQAKLDAKDQLLGQMRKCPRCNSAVLIAPPPEATPPLATDAANAAESTGIAEPELRQVDAPGRLSRGNRYLICDRDKVIAAWENNGQGWRLKTEFGFVSAARNPDKIPGQGDFKLVELRMALVDGEHRLQGLRLYQLVQRWALTAIGRDDDGICKSISGIGYLMRDQKGAVRRFLGEHIMRTIWGDATAVLDYLANDDYHSAGVGD